MEQSQIAKSGFDPQVVHSASNLEPVSAAVNNQKAAIYNSIRPDLTGGSPLRVRDWLAGQTFADQRRFGLDPLRALTGG